MLGELFCKEASKCSLIWQSFTVSPSLPAVGNTVNECQNSVDGLSGLHIVISYLTSVSFAPQCKYACKLREFPFS